MKRILILMAITTTMLLGCKKQNDWLDVKSDKNDIVPKSLKDMQALLDNEMLMNANGCAMGLVASDNYYVTPSWYNSNLVAEKNAYIYNSDIYEGTFSHEWFYPYKQVAQANVVLEGLQDITPATAEQKQYDDIKGQAMFYRGVAFYNLLQSFAKPYDANTAATDPGIPLKITADVNVLLQRASVKESYEQAINDVTTAIGLLPAVGNYQTRPTKAAAHGMLARLYLCMQNYSNALIHATAALNSYSFLIDYNTISPTAAQSFSAYPNNKEVIWYNTNMNYGMVASGFALVDTTLHRSYAVNDLRRTVFYKVTNPTTVMFKGDYTGQNIHFAGVATNELYLIKAECLARTGEVMAAMTELNTLLQKRWKTGMFTALTATNANDALVKILEHRRKELPFTAQLRWEDLRRLNKDPQFSKTLVKVLSGLTYTLPPNDNRWVYPIPDAEVRLSGIVQNPR